MNLGGTELLIVFIIIILVFGAGKVPEAARSLGRSLREFRKEVGDESGDETEPEADFTPPPPPIPDEPLTASAEELPTLDDLFNKIEGATPVERLAFALQTVFEVYDTNPNRLADETGIHRSTIGRWLTGEMKNPPQRENLETVLAAIPELSQQHRLEILAIAGYVSVADAPVPPNPIQIYLSCHGDDMTEERTQVSRYLPRRELGFSLQTADTDLTPAEIEAALDHSDFLVLVQGLRWMPLRHTEHQTAVEIDSLISLYFQRAGEPLATEARHFHDEAVGSDRWRSFTEARTLSPLVFAALQEKLIAGFRLGKTDMSLYSLTALFMVNQMFSRQMFEVPALLQQWARGDVSGQSVEATEQSEGETEFQQRSDIEPELVKVPAGYFWMGSDKRALERAGVSGYDDEYLQHQLYLPTYYIGRYPVTNAEFAHFVRDGGYRHRQFWTGAGWQRKEKNDWIEPEYWHDEKWNRSDLPVVGVSWFECVAYCHWLQKVTGRPYRLPTEAEWEKAARGSDGWIWPWGNTRQPDYCNTREKGPGQTTAVGHYSPRGDSPYGAADMVGNVWEWCATAAPNYNLKEYPYQLEDEWSDDYLDRTNVSVRALRGGSCNNNNELNARCAYRNRGNDNDRNVSSGCRLVVSPIF